MAQGEFKFDTPAQEDWVKIRLSSVALTNPLEDTTTLVKYKSSFLCACVALNSNHSTGFFFNKVYETVLQES